MDVAKLGLIGEKLVRQSQAPSELQHELLEPEAPLDGVDHIYTKFTHDDIMN